MGLHKLNTADLVIIAGYLVCITIFGLRFRKPQRSLRDYFLADRGIPWWAISLSIVAAETSTLTIISTPGIVYDKNGNFSFLQLVFGYLLGRVVICLLFIPQYFRGEMFTGRDNVHAHLMKNPPPVDLRGAVLYHCGPVMLKQEGDWQVKAAGPTTSSREEPYQADIIRRYGVRAVVGKGGMGAKTLGALKDSGAVYLNAIGGAAQYYARSVRKVRGVHLMEFGIPEAMWHLEVHDFVAIVTMDAHGRSLHADVEKVTGEALAALEKT